MWLQTFVGKLMTYLSRNKYMSCFCKIKKNLILLAEILGIEYFLNSRPRKMHWNSKGG